MAKDAVLWYYIRMNYEYYLFSKTKMRARAKALGIAAVTCAVIFFTAPYIALVLGSFAILFGVLSLGGEEKASKDSKVSIISGLIAIIIAVSMFASVYFSLRNNVEYRHNVEEYMDTIYGTLYEEEYGEKFSERMEKFFAGRTE